MAGVQIELRAASDPTVLGRTSTDGAGQVTFPDVPPGKYVLKATRAGFLMRDSATFEVKAGEIARVLLVIQLIFVLPDVEVRAETPSPTDSVQPVSMGDMLAGAGVRGVQCEGGGFGELHG